MKSEQPWTDEIVRQICDLIEETGITLMRACEYYGMSPQTFSAYTSGKEPTRPEWSVWYRRARAHAEVGWLNKHATYAELGNTAGVKAAESRLRVLDPEFREDFRGSGGHITINIQQSDPKTVEIPEVEVTVLEKDDGFLLPGSE